jgi:hypothetical protein
MVAHNSVTLASNRPCHDARSRRLLALLALGCTISLSGCLTTEQWLTKKGPPTGEVSHLAAKWENQVFQAPNLDKNGETIPCLGGRLYLFGPDMKFPIAAKGTITVQMLVDGLVEADGRPKALETWNYGAKDLKAGLNKDIIGWGYTVLLPWSTFHPGITNVELVLCYTPPQGVPLYSRTPLRLQHEQREFQKSVQVQTSK